MPTPQKFIRVLNDKMVEVRKLNGTTYPCVLAKGVTIPEPVLDGTANYITCFVEYEPTPTVHGWDYQEKPTIDEQQDYEELLGVY